jgi:hypothetical protein
VVEPVALVFIDLIRWTGRGSRADVGGCRRLLLGSPRPVLFNEGEEALFTPVFV